MIRGVEKKKKRKETKLPPEPIAHMRAAVLSFLPGGVKATSCVIL
jgi:hypothetical protein